LADAGGWFTDGPFEISAGGSANQVDLYLDTDDQRFRRAGYSLRIRRVNRRRSGEATLKGLTSESSASAPGIRIRPEISQPLESADVEVLAGSDGPVAERIGAIAGRKPLVRLFEVRTHRQVFSIGADGASAGEIAVDATRIVPGGGAPETRLRRVELEVMDGTAEALEPLTDRLRIELGLRPAYFSKYEVGLLAAGIPTLAAETLGATDYDADATIGAVALAVLRRQFATFVDNEAGTRLGEDIECLHDMRVASRRLRAAFSLFSEVLPPRLVLLQDEFRWIGGILGSVRDLDVQLEQLDDWRAKLAEEERSALDGLVSLLDEQRADARKKMLAALESDRYESLLNRFARAMRAAPRQRSELSSSPARDVAPSLIDARLARFLRAARRIGRNSPAGDYHRLRIEGKRLRYTLEFFAGLNKEEMQPLAKRLTALQDILGLHQDADVAIVRLRAMVDEHSERLEPRTVFAMGEIAERYRGSMGELRAQVPRAVKRVRKRARDLTERQ